MLDWMKALGMCLIVYGHVAHATTIPLTPPIYLKQLGVAFFLFATGFTLARERRPPSQVVFNRLFPVYLFGLSFAVVMTVVTAFRGMGLALSNYLPFAAGANVVFDNFPANPTTWYLGTYVHLLLIWALWLRHHRVRAWMILAALACEIPIRAILIQTAGLYVAYMLSTNWAAIFLIGLMCGATRQESAKGSPLPFVLTLLAAVAGWGLVMRSAGFEPTFPFMTLHGWPSAVNLLLVSASTSILYLSATALVFAAARRLGAPAAVRFISRNSLIIFLAHMPVFYALHPLLVSWGLGYWTRVGIQLLVNLPLLALLSELLLSAVDPDKLRNRVWAAVVGGQRFGPSSRIAGSPLGQSRQ